LDYQRVVEDYHKESDRAAIVLAGSFVEHYLAAYIKRFMIEDEAVTKKLFRGFGPFSTFDQRISGAYAFKLIPSHIRDDLELIRHIRNHFAHSPHATSLTDAEVRDKFYELSTAKDPAYNSKGDGVLTDRRLIYLYAVSNFVVFCHNVQIQHPRAP
jgi:DNA-binding MltR family transcriptional regulator